MPSIAPAWSSLLLATGLLLAPQESPWKTDYDYTNLPPTNEEFWAPVVAAKLQMEEAIAVAGKDEGPAFRVLRGELVNQAEGPVWRFEAFTGSGEGPLRRVNVTVSTQEPKILRRVELLSLTDEDKTWLELLPKLAVSAEGAIDLCKKNSGVGLDVVTDPRMRKIELEVESALPRWRTELMGIEKEAIRRFDVAVSGHHPRVKEKKLIDRFAGEPLRANQPFEGPQGLVMYDFVVGDGETVTETSKVEVNYRLFLLDNTKLHDTWQKKFTETFLLTEAPLKGMTVGMVGMRVGGRRKICIPYSMAFGEKGNAIAPPKAMVVCDVRVEQIVP